MSVVDLKESSPNVWKAVYKSEAGMFLTVVKIDEEETTRPFCSCLSEGSTCWHVPILQEAVRQHKIISEFEQQPNHNVDDYAQLLRTTLDGMQIDYDDIDDIFSVDGMDIYIMDYLFDKARYCVLQNEFDQAIAICKACINEYTTWLYLNTRRCSCFNLDYQDLPFEILRHILFMFGGEYVEDLLNYSKSEIEKLTYNDDLVYHCILDLFMEASAMKGSGDFIVFIDKLIHELGENTVEARNIVDLKEEYARYYNYYHKNKNV